MTSKTHSLNPAILDIELKKILAQSRKEDEKIFVSKELDQRILRSLRQTILAGKPSKQRSFLPLWAGLSAALAIFIFILFLTPIFDSSPTLFATKGTVDVNNKIITKKSKTGNKAIIKVAANSTATLKINKMNLFLEEDVYLDYSLTPDSKLTLFLGSGNGHFEMAEGSQQTTVLTPYAEFIAKNGSFDVFVEIDKKTTSILVKSGEVSKINGDKKEILSAGQIFHFSNQQKHSPTIKKDTKPNTSTSRETIYLRNGNVIVGDIISQREGQVTIKTKYGVMSYTLADIEKIDYAH